MNLSDRDSQHLREFLQNCTNAQAEAILAALRTKFPDAWEHISGKRPHNLEIAWGVAADVILGAIERSPDITQRGVRGIVAEAVFEGAILPHLRGWQSLPTPNEASYDFAIQDSARPTTPVRIQVKLQRSEKGAPKTTTARKLKRLMHAPDLLYVVEVQKTRTGKRKGEDTRPYRFGDFDILAVCMHPSTGDWLDFRYIPASWLLPRLKGESGHLIEIMQPVAPAPDQYWTNSLAECLSRLASAERKLLYSTGESAST